MHIHRIKKNKYPDNVSSGADLAVPDVIRQRRENAQKIQEKTNKEPKCRDPVYKQADRCYIENINIMHDA